MTWVQVESFDYSEQYKVKLTYSNITQIHRVKCIKTSTGAPPPPEALLWIKFKDGQSEVTEYWNTKDKVEAEEWHWEVYLP